MKQTHRLTLGPLCKGPSSAGRCVCGLGRQQGAVAVTVALCLLFLLGFMGLALDFGRLFVIRSELQTAVDSCALAAARELDGRADALARGSSAGRTAGNANAVNFQSANWASRAQLTDASLQFFDRELKLTTQPALARYARCRHEHEGAGAWLLTAWQGSGGQRSPDISHRVMAQATATRLGAQTACPLPLALRIDTQEGGSSTALAVGQWVKLVSKKGLASKGEIGWANLDGSSSAAQTERELMGSCGTRVGDRLGTPGVQASMADVWNLRFGIYKNNPPAQPDGLLDATGYAYTKVNWPSQSSAYQGATPANAGVTAANYLAKSAQRASCADTGTSVTTCESITGLKISVAFKTLAPPGPAYGGSSRVVLVPTVDDSARVTGYACMLMLQPLSAPLVDVQLEYLGNASDAASPCVTAGLPGGGAGPLVATLVR